MTTSSPRRKQKSPSIALTEDDFRLIDEAFKTFDMGKRANLKKRRKLRSRWIGEFDSA